MRQGEEVEMIYPGMTGSSTDPIVDEVGEEIVRLQRMKAALYSSARSSAVESEARKLELEIVESELANLRASYERLKADYQEAQSKCRASVLIEGSALREANKRADMWRKSAIAWMVISALGATYLLVVNTLS